MTVEKNILMPMLLDRRKPDKEYFDTIIETLGIADKIESLPSQLSGGQQQRAAIARSLIYRPAILLITHDEKIALETERIVTIEDGRIVSDQKRR